MNREDRKTLKGIVESLEKATADLEELSSDLNDRLCSVQEYFSEGPTVERLEEEIELIDAAMGLADEAATSPGEMVE